MKFLKNIKSEGKYHNSNLVFFNDMFTEMENYIKTIKPKVLLNTENLNKIKDIIKIINKISKLPDQSRINYETDCSYFINLESNYSDRKRIYKLD